MSNINSKYISYILRLDEITVTHKKETSFAIDFPLHQYNRLSILQLALSRNENIDDCYKIFYSIINMGDRLYVDCKTNLLTELLQISYDTNQMYSPKIFLKDKMKIYSNISKRINSVLYKNLIPYSTDKHIELETSGYKARNIPNLATAITDYSSPFYYFVEATSPYQYVEFYDIISIAIGFGLAYLQYKNEDEFFINNDFKNLYKEFVKSCPKFKLEFDKMKGLNNYGKDND